MARKPKGFKKQLIDQTLHFLWSFIALMPLIINPSWFTGVLSGFLIAAPREFWDQRPINNKFDTALDLGFFILGGLCIGIIGDLINA